MQLTEGQRRLEREEIELLTEVKGVQYRMGHILYKDVDKCLFMPPMLNLEICNELGIDPEHNLASLLAVFMDYLDKRKCS